MTIAYADICLAELEAWFLEAERHALAWSELGISNADARATRWMDIAARCRDELSRRAALGNSLATVTFEGTVSHASYNPAYADFDDDAWTVFPEAGRVRLSCATWFAVIADEGTVRGGGNCDPLTLREALLRIVAHLDGFNVDLAIDAPALPERQRVIRRRRRG